MNRNRQKTSNVGSYWGFGGGIWSFTGESSNTMMLFLFLCITKKNFKLRKGSKSRINIICHEILLMNLVNKRHNKTWCHINTFRA
jgi:hypothetical protein